MEERARFHPRKAERTWQPQPHGTPSGSGFTVNQGYRREGLLNLTTGLREDTAVRHVACSGTVQHGGSEGLLCEALKVKPRLGWRPQDVGDLQTGYGVSPREKVCCGKQ